MTDSRPASQRITEEVTSWDGVESGYGKRGEFGFYVNGHEVGHLHGDHAAHFSFGKEIGTALREQGRVVDHPVFPGKPGPAARRIETDEVEHGVDPLSDAPARPTKQFGHGCDVLRNASVRKQADPLQHVADAAAQCHRIDPGHVPPVLRMPDGTTRLLTGAHHPPIGTRSDAKDQEPVPFPTGSMLVLYTDGLIERRDASHDAGIARVTQAVSRLGDADAEATADAVVTAAGSSNEDDIAVLVLRVGPGA